MGGNQSKLTDTINWNNVNTNEFSSNIPNMNNISHQATELINNLKFDNSNDNISSDVNLQSIINTNKRSNKKLISNKINKLSDSNMSSSPFISSEMYNHIINKYNANNKLNTNKNNLQTNMVGGGNNDDINTSTSSSISISNSSSVSSSSVSSSLKKSKKDKKKLNNKEHNKESHNNKERNNKEPHKNIIVQKNKKNKKNNISTESLNLSYISSSAHTGGGSVNSSSIKNENDYNQSSSVNTNDINMFDS